MNLGGMDWCVLDISFSRRMGLAMSNGSHGISQDARENWRSLSASVVMTTAADTTTNVLPKLSVFVAPATSNRTGGFPASRLTAKASSIGVMGPFSWGMLSRASTPRGSLERGPTFRTQRRYSTASSQIPRACTSWPPVASPCVRPRT
jgi:hypothetical protein